MKRLLLLITFLICSISLTYSQGAGTAASIYKSTFANLGTPADGSVRYCTNCNANTSPCTSGGTGAFANRVNGAWSCGSATGSGTSGSGTANQVSKFTAATVLGDSGRTDTGTTITDKLTETAASAATTALAGTGAGNTTNGAHSVKVTFVTAGGETSAGTASNATTVTDNTTNGQIAITAIPLGSSLATARKVYMNTVAAPTVWKLLSNGTISNNTATTLTANDSDATLGASTTIPSTNTAIDARLTLGQSAVTVAVPLTVSRSTTVTASTTSVKGLTVAGGAEAGVGATSANSGEIVVGADASASAVMAYDAGTGFAYFGNRWSGAGETVRFVTDVNSGTPVVVMTLTNAKAVKMYGGLTVTTDTGSASYSTATNCSDSAGAAACGSAAAGAFVIDAASTSTVVSTTAVTANSQVFVQEDSSLGTRLGVTCNTQSSLTLGALRVTARTAGTSFTVTLEVGPTTNPMCVSYFIVN